MGAKGYGLKHGQIISRAARSVPDGYELSHKYFPG
jgi:hypothetical protein